MIAARSSLVNDEIPQTVRWLRKSFPFNPEKYFLKTRGMLRRTALRMQETEILSVAVDLLCDAGVRFGAPRPIACRRLVAILLGAALIAIVPVAHSSPPDPSWLAGGLYDDGDHDDAILAIIGASGVPAPGGVAVLRARPSNPCAMRAAPERLLAPSRITTVNRSPPPR
jgi:hypothetical protein